MNPLVNETGEINADLLDLTLDKLSDAEKAQLLANLASNGEILADTTKTPPEKAAAVHQIRMMLSTETPPIQQVLDSGVFTNLLKFLEGPNGEADKHEAIWAVTNVLSGNHQHTEQAIALGVIPALLPTLESTDPEVTRQTMWALGNIAGEVTQCRARVLTPEVIHAMCNSNQIKDIAKRSREHMRNTAWVLSNFCRNKPIAPALSEAKLFLAPLRYLLDSRDPQTVTDVCWGLSYISESSEGLKLVLDKNVVPKLCSLLLSQSKSVIPALRAVGNIASGEDYAVDLIVNFGVLPVLQRLVKSEDRRVGKEATWTLSNVAAGTMAQKRQLIKHNVHKTILELIADPAVQDDLKREACWVASNITSGSQRPMVQTLVMDGILAGYVQMLDMKDDGLIRNALTCMNYILKQAQGDIPHPYVDLFDELGLTAKVTALSQNKSWKIKAQKVLTTLSECRQGLEPSRAKIDETVQDDSDSSSDSATN